MDKIILVVDDSAVQRASVKYALLQIGIEVVEAGDGKEGLKVLNTLRKNGRSPAMIITDINMPSMNGIDFIKQVKKTKNKFLPILVLTTESQKKIMNEGKRAGASGWLIKPFTQAQLIKIIRKFIRD